MVATFTDYTGAAAGSPTSGPSLDTSTKYADLGKLKKQYLDYLLTKRLEIDEQIAARRYRHGAQYTAEQMEALRLRKQPVVTYNRISRKIDGVVGLVERMRQDPKAFPRTPQHEDGAELATAVLRYVLDEQEWKAKSPIIAADAATDGIGGLEVVLEQGDKGDAEVGFEVVSPEDFFYDPRSFKHDFSDARYMGVGKWIDVDLAKEMFPDKADDINASIDSSDLTSNSDKDQKWFMSEEGRVRIVDHWYMWKGQWCYAIYIGSMKLQEGVSYLKDEKGKTICKYVMFSANVDHDGDRYGFVRQLKSAQDEVNSRRSKGLHELNTRRIIGEVGAFDDIEVARREAARPDGVVLRNPGTEAEFDDAAKQANLQGQLEFLQEAKNEIENFGPNPALVGQGIDSKSGRAIQLMQQAGLAELGPYIIGYRGWKIRVYRALFMAVQEHWTAERWIRVTDSEGLAQFIQVNGLQMHPVLGVPVMVNAIGSLDVDIIIDEGADSVNMMADAYDTLTVLASKGAQVPPQVLIELSPLDSTVKKRLLEIMQQSSQPGPGQQLQLAEVQSNIIKNHSQAYLNYANANTADPADAPQGGPQTPAQAMAEHLTNAKTAADINLTNAKAAHTSALANKTTQDTSLAPVQFAHDVYSAEKDRQAAQRAPAGS